MADLRAIKQTHFIIAHTHKSVPKERRRISIAGKKPVAPLHGNVRGSESIARARENPQALMDNSGQLMSKVIFSQQTNVFRFTN
jgi:hypothetical protein